MKHVCLIVLLDKFYVASQTKNVYAVLTIRHFHVGNRFHTGLQFTHTMGNKIAKGITSEDLVLHYSQQ